MALPTSLETSASGKNETESNASAWMGNAFAVGSAASASGPTGGADMSGLIWPAAILAGAVLVAAVMLR